MKKTYNNPAMTIVKIQSQHLLAGSEQVGVKGNYNSGTVTIASREFDFGFDDEE